MQFPRNLTTVCLVFLTILSLALAQLTAASASFSQNLQLRNSGDDVTRLQRFLNAENYFVAQSGPGSPGNETTTFGLRTYQALMEFQQARGLPATDFFGPLTRSLIATLAATSTATSTSTSIGTSTVAAPQPPAVAPAFSPFASTTSGYIPGVTPLPGYKPGQLIFIGGPSAPATPPVSPPAPAPYVAKAVHFDGNSVLNNLSLASSDNGTASFSLWFKVPASPIEFPTYWIVDPDNFNAAAVNFTQSQADIGAFFSTDGAPYISTPFANPAAATPDAWHNFLGTVDVRQNPPVFKLYLDGVPFDFTPIIEDGLFDGASVLTFNGLPIWIGNDQWGNAVLGDMADVYIAPGVSLLDGINDIPSATLHKFISADGKPVDLGSDCSAAIGTSPAICLSGDSSTFASNKGTGGAFTLTGTLTNADTSPSN